MPNTREELVDLINRSACVKYGGEFGDEIIQEDIDISDEEIERIADYLIANGVTVQSDVIEKINIHLGRLNSLLLGNSKEFDERMAGYTPSAFCAGFDYAIQLVMGFLTQLPELPKEG